MGDESGANARLTAYLGVNLDALRKGFADAGREGDAALAGFETRAKRTQDRLTRNIEAIRLTQQLDLARAAGNSKVAEKLEEEILLRKTVVGLQRQGIKAAEAQALAETHVAALSRAKKSNEGVGGAARSVFDHSRLTVLEEGGARIGVFGSALEKIGPYGIAAAAGVAAFGISLERAEKAMEWSEELVHLADRLGLTTTELQELNFVALKTGVSQETLADGLQKVSQSIGAYTSNVKDARVKSIFEALGISKADARAFDGPLDGLEKIADAIAKIQDHSQRLALLKNLKVPDEMVTVLLQGGEKIREMAAEAKELGLVMDAGSVKKMAELAEKAKVAKEIIGAELRQAFVGLAPVVLQIVNLMAKMATFAAATAETFGAMTIDWRTGQVGSDLTKFSSHHLEEDAKGSAKQMADNAGAKAASSKGAFSGTGVDWVRSAAYDRAKAYNEQVTAEIARRAKGAPEEATIPAGALAPEKTSKTKAAPQDKTSDLDSSAKEALESAQKAAAQAYAALATSVDAKAVSERRAINADTADKLEHLAKQEADVLTAKVDAHRAAQIALLEEAKTEVQNAAAARLELINRNLLIEHIKVAADLAEQDANDRAEALKREAQHLSAQAALASTTADRNRLERAALNLQQKAEADLADAKVKLTLALLAQATLSQDPDKIASANVAYLGALSARKALPQQKADQDAAQADKDKRSTPWGAWADDGNKAAADVGKVLQEEAVKGVNALNDGLINSKGHFNDLGSVAKSVIGSLMADLEKFLLKQAEIGIGNGAGPLLQSAGSAISSSIFGAPIPGHAAGTDSSPGGWHWTGEDGPELVNMRPGAKVIPNNLLRSFGKPQQAGGTVTVIQPHYNDFSGAVVTDDLIRSMDQKAAIAAQRGAQMGHQMTMTRLQQQRRNTL